MFEFWDWSFLLDVKQQQNRLQVYGLQFFHLGIKLKVRAAITTTAQLRCYMSPVVCDIIVSSVRREVGREQKGMRQQLQRQPQS